MSASRPPGRLDGEWLVATMIYASTREARAPGFDSWYRALLALLPRATKVLLVAGSYDSDGTIEEFLGEAKKRGKPIHIHFVEGGPLRKTYELKFPKLGEVLEDLDSFAEREGIKLDGDDEELHLGLGGL